jgi:hypothetical protein
MTATEPRRPQNFAAAEGYRLAHAASGSDSPIVLLRPPTSSNLWRDMTLSSAFNGP